MKFIRIQESTRHWCYVTLDEIRNEIDVTKNPYGFGYTNMEVCMAQFTNPEAFGAKGNVPFPVQSKMGPVTFHIEGLMDSDRRWKTPDLKQKQPGHRCDPNNPECREAMVKAALGIPQETKL